MKRTKKSYFPDTVTDKHRRALAMAKNRGEIAKEWLKNNKLTKETMPEFQRLMKQADKDFKTREK